jgi:ADP-ribosylglycohydrolase
MKSLLLESLLSLLLLIIAGCTTSDENLNEASFRDKIYACWLGKNIGGTLGMPFEGKTDINDISFYTNLKPDEPSANDDLDLQILWLKAMEENNGRIDAYTLGKYWLKYVPVDWNEYGVGKENMKMGIMPPLSGEYNNSKWKTSNGAWIRSEIWACLAPGNPMLAAKFAWEDACVDHGVAEGTIAEIFTASLESAAFIEQDVRKLIAFGLSMIPESSETAAAIWTVVRAREAGKEWQTARDEVIKVTEKLGWFQAPRNVAFTMIGLLWGNGDFGKSICIAVNCGDDTDCTGATAGSILGIIGGTKIIPNKWRTPIGDKIINVAISGFEAPRDINALTDKTLDMAKKMTIIYRMPFSITDKKTKITGLPKLLYTDKNELGQLLNRSPYRITCNEQNISVTIDYFKDPLIRNDDNRQINIVVQNQSYKEKDFEVKLVGTPEGMIISGVPPAPFRLSQQSVRSFDLLIKTGKLKSDHIRMNLSVLSDTGRINIPVTFVREKINRD